MTHDMINRADAIAAINNASGADLCSCSHCRSGYDAAIEEIRALPAYEVGVKHGEIDRAVWSAMIWAASNNPAFNDLPEYTDRGNSFAEDECRRAAARIRSALVVTPTYDPAKVQALVEAVEHEIHRSRRHLAKSTLDALAAFKVGEVG